MNTSEESQEPWPVWIVGNLVVPAQVWIRDGIRPEAVGQTDPDSKTMWCTASQDLVWMGAGDGTCSYLGWDPEDAETISAAARRRGHNRLRLGWVRQIEENMRMLTASIKAIRKELRQGCLPNIPGHARGIEELGEDIANLAYKLQGWIAMDGGPVDPLCQAYDAAAPSIRGGIGGPPDDELQA